VNGKEMRDSSLHTTKERREKSGSKNKNTLLSLLACVGRLSDKEDRRQHFFS